MLKYLTAFLKPSWHLGVACSYCVSESQLTRPCASVFQPRRGRRFRADVCEPNLTGRRRPMRYTRRPAILWSYGDDFSTTRYAGATRRFAWMPGKTGVRAIPSGRGGNCHRIRTGEHPQGPKRRGEYHRCYRPGRCVMKSATLLGEQVWWR